MKKVACLSLVLMLFAGAMAGCAGNNNSTAETEPTSAAEETKCPEVQRVFTFDNSLVEVIVDLHDNYSADVGDMALYLYDGPVSDGASNVVAWGTYMTQSDYETFLSDNAGKYEEAGGLIICKDEIDLTHYIASFTEGGYYDVTVNVTENTDEIYSRFRVSLLQTIEEAEPAAVPQAYHEFIYGTNVVGVTFDLYDGWSVEFGEQATYFYDCPIAKSGDAYSWGCATQMDQEEMDVFVAENGDKDTFAKDGDIITFTDDTDVANVILPITDGLYLRVLVYNYDDPVGLAARFSTQVVDTVPEVEEETEEETEAETEAAPEEESSEEASSEESSAEETEAATEESSAE